MRRTIEITDRSTEDGYSEWIVRPLVKHHEEVLKLVIKLLDQESFKEDCIQNIKSSKRLIAGGLLVLSNELKKIANELINDSTH